MTTPPLLTGDEIAARLLGLEWKLEGDTIVRDLRFDDFAAAIAYVNRVAEVAETYNHHPDMLDTRVEQGEAQPHQPRGRWADGDRLRHGRALRRPA